MIGRECCNQQSRCGYSGCCKHCNRCIRCSWFGCRSFSGSALIDADVADDDVVLVVGGGVGHLDLYSGKCEDLKGRRKFERNATRSGVVDLNVFRNDEITIVCQV